jgi:hypothetical protein
MATSSTNALDGPTCWRQFPDWGTIVVVLRRVFRGKFVDSLKDAFHQGGLVFPGSLRPLAAEKAFAAFLRPLFRKEWFVYSKRPFGGPKYVLHYLARYTHRVAISNHRLLSVADGNVTFRWKDHAHGSKQRMSVDLPPSRLSK